jgi:hypothetical protein
MAPIYPWHEKGHRRPHHLPPGDNGVHATVKTPRNPTPGVIPKTLNFEDTSS